MRNILDLKRSQLIRVEHEVLATKVVVLCHFTKYYYYYFQNSFSRNRLISTISAFLLMYFAVFLALIAA